MSAGFHIHRSILLTQGKVAWVDQADYAALALSKWHADHRESRDVTYARRYCRGSGRSGRRAERMHRIVVGLLPGDLRVVDHINGDGLDNRRSNLRVCSVRQNAHNLRARCGTSLFKGVSSHKASGLWRVQIRAGGNVSRCVGYFHEEEEAARAYDAAAMEAFGEFSKLNFPKAVA